MHYFVCKFLNYKFFFVGLIENKNTDYSFIYQIFYLKIYYVEVYYIFAKFFTQMLFAYTEFGDTF